MCGIAGYIGARPVSDGRIGACSDLMRRRGPDHRAAARWTTPAGRHIHFLHSRLNIIDLDPRANQPFRSGPLTMIFNGELYNYIELRRELEAAGAAFRTTSDTEVLAAAVVRWGWQALDRFEGMWALAAHDERTGDVTLCRDRFGEKPLYLLRAPDGLYFGSEIKYLFSMRGETSPVNRDQIFRYLVNGYKSLYKSPRTFFDGVEELAPATLLTIDASGRESSRAYWSAAYRPDDGMTYEDAVARARDLLVRSMELRSRADVKLAFCLSGGVDSTALISIAKKLLNFDVHGFTIMSADPRYDEAAGVRESVSHLGIRHTPVPADPSNFLENMRELVRQHDAPVYTITYYTHWRLMERMARDGYRISVSGTAADELFSGYYDHHLAYLHDIRSENGLYVESRAEWERHVKPHVRNPYLSNPELFIKDPAMRDYIFLDADRFSGFTRGGWSEPFGEETYTDSLLRNRMLNEMFHENVPVILHEDDLNAMYHSIENRSPYLDRALFEFAYTIPTRHLIRRGRAKAILRDAVRDVAPPRVIDNPRKVGFNAPIQSYLDCADARVRARLLEESPVFDYIRRDAIEPMLGTGGLLNSQSKFLFYFVSVKLFLEEFSR